MLSATYPIIPHRIILYSCLPFTFLPFTTLASPLQDMHEFGKIGQCDVTILSEYKYKYETVTLTLRAKHKSHSLNHYASELRDRRTDRTCCIASITSLVVLRLVYPVGTSCMTLSAMCVCSFVCEVSRTLVNLIYSTIEEHPVERTRQHEQYQLTREPH